MICPLNSAVPVSLVEIVCLLLETTLIGFELILEVSNALCSMARGPPNDAKNTLSHFDVGFLKRKKLMRRLEILKKSSRNNEMTTCHRIMFYINKSQVLFC